MAAFLLSFFRRDMFATSSTSSDTIASSWTTVQPSSDTQSSTDNLQAQLTGQVIFLAEVPQIHTGSVAKKVYASYATPIFGEVTLASDFTPPETTNNVTSTQIYGTTLGSTSSTLGQGSFTAYLNDGVTDALVTLKNENLWFRFFPNKFASSNILAQGKLGISRTFPAGDNIQAACTISASEAAIEVA